MLVYRKMITLEQLPLMLVDHLVLFGPEQDYLPEKISYKIMELEMTFHTNIGKFGNFLANLRSNEAINYNKIKKYIKLAQRSIVELTHLKNTLSKEHENPKAQSLQSHNTSELTDDDNYYQKLK